MKTLFALILMALTAFSVDVVTSSASAADLKVASSVNRLVVIEPPANFRSIASQIGFTVGKEFVLEALEMNAIMVQFPASLSIDKAAEKLENRFPGILVDGGDFAS